VFEPQRSGFSSARVQNARDALLDGRASTLLEPVRDVICEPTRTQIVRALSVGPFAVGELADILDRSKSATSQHLRILRDGGTVIARRRGRTVIYSLANRPMVEAILAVLNRAAMLGAEQKNALPLLARNGQHPGVRPARETP
jgi:DNA-binding transcriptional ArsR family regulator